MPFLLLVLLWLDRVVNDFGNFQSSGAWLDGRISGRAQLLKTHDSHSI